MPLSVCTSWYKTALSKTPHTVSLFCSLKMLVKKSNDRSKKLLQNRLIKPPVKYYHSLKLPATVIERFFSSKIKDQPESHRWSNRFHMPCQSARSLPEENSFEKFERLRKLMLGFKNPLGMKLMEGIKCGANMSTKPSWNKIFPVTTVLVVNLAAFFREAYNRHFRRQNWAVALQNSWHQV